MKPIGAGLKAYKRGLASGKKKESIENPYDFLGSKQPAVAAWWQKGYDEGLKEAGIS